MGVSVGFEYVEADEDVDNTLIVDLLIVRMMLQWK
jgi:hypothetical protein